MMQVKIFVDIALFHWKVFQKRSTNQDISMTFASAYVLEFSPEVIRKDKIMGQIC